jgi:hypothetical protein
VPLAETHALLALPEKIWRTAHDGGMIAHFVAADKPGFLWRREAAIKASLARSFLHPLGAS